VRLPPLALGTVVDRTPGVRRFQIVQDGPASLAVRLEPDADAEPEQVWGAVRDALAGLLAAHGVRDARVRRDADPPRRSPGGKFRAVYAALD
jgi:hypothetical protein